MASLDISLDDMIKSRRNSDRKGRGQSRVRRGSGPVIYARGGGRTFAAIRRNPLGVNAGRSAYPISKIISSDQIFSHASVHAFLMVPCTELGAGSILYVLHKLSFRRAKTLPWKKGLFEDSLKAAGMSGLENGTKLYVSNFDGGVTGEDIRELFSNIGELDRYALHFDKNGRPSGSAEVVYIRRNDAFQAFQRYNNVQLDGRPMKIEIIGGNDVPPVITAPMNVAGGAAGRKRNVVMNSGAAGRGRGGFSGAYRPSARRGRGVGPSTRGGGRGRGRGGARGKTKKSENKTADELDKELENYHSEAMQT